MEKLKDLFYDMSDTLLSILIIAVMFYTISWKLSDTMSYTPSFDIPFISSNANADIPDAEPIDGSEIAINEDSAFVTSENTEAGGEVIDMTPPSTDTQELPETPSVETPTPQAAKPEGQTIEVIQSKEVEFVVPSGMLASKIIQKLVDEGLIDDKSAFTSRLSERKLDSKLRSGTFKLRADMSYDQIINKLTGQ